MSEGKGDGVAGGTGRGREYCVQNSFVQLRTTTFAAGTSGI